MNDDRDVSESGQPIFRHQPRSKEFEFAIGNEEAMEAICQHVETHIGKIDMVFHELISDLVHIDVHQIKPTPERDFWTLVTTGMSDRPMTVPDGAPCSPYAELMICLPSSWPVTQEAFKDEENYWPVRLLKMLSRLPHEYDTWLAPGHTVPNNDPPEPYTPGTEFCCALMTTPLTTPPEFDRLEVSPGKVVEFLGVVVLYEEEVNLKLKKGTEVLGPKLGKAGVTELLQPGRRNVAKRSRWPF
jgi:Suppressor of fused protein (SUFU)